MVGRASFIENRECDAATGLSRTSGTIGGSRFSVDDWVLGNEIAVFRTPDVDPSLVPVVCEGIENMLSWAQADLRVNVYDTYSFVNRQVTHSIESGSLNYNSLAKRLLIGSWRSTAHGGWPHADFVITRHPIYANSAFWGQAMPYTGLAILGLPGNRVQNTDFIQRIVSHEVGHLLGLGVHHEDDTPVTGYARSLPCNMESSARGHLLCDQCTDAVRAAWRGVVVGSKRNRIRYVP